MPKIVPLTVEKVIEADNERKDWALWLAHCELGLEPRFKDDRDGHEAYSAALQKRANEIWRRLN